MAKLRNIKINQIDNELYIYAHVTKNGCSTAQEIIHYAPTVKLDNLNINIAALYNMERGKYILSFVGFNWFSFSNFKIILEYDDDTNEELYYSASDNKIGLVWSENVEVEV